MSIYDIKPLETSKDKIEQPLAAIEDIIPKLTSNMLFVGASGSGKSTLLVQLMTQPQFYQGWHDEVYLISPTGRSDDVQGHLNLDEDNIIDDLDSAPAFIAELMEQQRDDIEDMGADKAKQIAIIYDDVISHRDLMKSKEFVASFVASRHYNFTTMLCTQSFTRVPRVARLQCQSLFYFKGGNSEMELLAEEMAAPGFSKRRMFNLINYATDDKYSFLHVNRRVPFETRYRRNLNEVIVLESVPEK
jgi:hypothetical protein